MKLKLMLLAIPICLLIADLSRAEFNYDYIESTYEYVETDTVDVFGQPLPLTADGYGIEFSHDYDTGFLVNGSFARFEFERDDGFGSTQDLFKFGAGYRYSFNEFYDVYGTVSFVGLETDLSGVASTENGFEIVGGLRIRPAEAFEIQGTLHYSDIEDPLQQTLSEIRGTGQAQWYFNDNLSIGLGISAGEYTTSYFGNFRVAFDSLPFGL